MIDPYVILAMSLNCILSSNLSFVLSKYPVFVMAIPLNMILVINVIPCILSHDFLNNHNNLVYICTYISLISMTNKSVMTSFLSIKYLSVCLYLCV